MFTFSNAQGRAVQYDVKPEADIDAWGTVYMCVSVLMRLCVHVCVCVVRFGSDFGISIALGNVLSRAANSPIENEKTSLTNPRGNELLHWSSDAKIITQT